MLQILSTGAVALLIGALFRLRARSRTGSILRRLERSTAAVFLGVGAVVAAAAVVPDLATVLGIGTPLRCAPKPKVPDRFLDPDAAELAQIKNAGAGDGEPAGIRLESIDRVAKLTGAGSLNRTIAAWDIAGTDLGHMFRHDGRVAVVFGDTFAGADRTGWRSNVMAWVGDPANPRGLVFDTMIEDRAGRARELIGSLKLRGWEETVIPTNGISLGDRMVLHYMSVRCWGPPGEWVVNHAGLAVSDDDGETWQRLDAARWPASSNFAQVAFLERGNDVFVYGIPEGRQGGAVIARVPRRQLLDLEAWRYWDGGTWSPHEDRAVTIVRRPVGELSVAWSDHLGRWLMLYLDEPLGAIVARTADHPRGPWTAPRIILSAVDFPTLYAPYIVPGPLDGPEVRFTLSRFDDYNVWLMRARIEPDPGR